MNFLLYTLEDLKRRFSPNPRGLVFSYRVNFGFVKEIKRFLVSYETTDVVSLSKPLASF